MSSSTSSLACGDCGIEIDPAHDREGQREPCQKCGSVKRAYTMHATNPRMTNYTLDNFIAHKLSELTACDAPDLADDSTWLNTFILSTIFRVRLEPKTRAYLFNFLRRAEGAIDAYRTACAAVREYVSTPRNVITPYFRSLSHFEICLSQAYQAYELLARASGETIYNQGDGSPEERLQMLYVDSKHMDRMISGDKLPPEATAGVWITNTGLSSARASLSFAELHAILLNLHGLAQKLSILSAGAEKKE
jgi:hypothetical protein